MTKKTSKRIVVYSRRAFYDTSTKEFTYLNDFLAVVTLIAVAGIVLETVASFGPYLHIFKTIEYLATLIFSIEYILRIIAAESPWKYIFSFFGIVDLLAILPTIFGLGNFVALKSIRMLRILRFLRIIRVARIARTEVETVKGHKSDPDDLSGMFSLNVMIYLLTLVTALIILGALLYFIEGSNPLFKDIPTAMLFVLNAFIGGIPLVGVPASSGGIAIAVVAKFVGMILLGFLIGIVGGMVNKVLLGKK